MDNLKSTSTSPVEHVRMDMFRKNAWRWSGRVKGYKLLGLCKVLLCDPHGAAVLNAPEKVEGTTRQKRLRAGREEARPHFPVPASGRTHHSVRRVGGRQGSPFGEGEA